MSLKRVEIFPQLVDFCDASHLLDTVLLAEMSRAKRRENTASSTTVNSNSSSNTQKRTILDLNYVCLLNVLQYCAANLEFRTQYSSGNGMTAWGMISPLIIREVPKLCNNRCIYITLQFSVAGKVIPADKLELYHHGLVKWNMTDDKQGMEHDGAILAASADPNRAAFMLCPRIGSIQFQRSIVGDRCSCSFAGTASVLMPNKSSSRWERNAAPASRILEGCERLWERLKQQKVRSSNPFRGGRRELAVFVGKNRQRL